VCLGRKRRKTNIQLVFEMQARRAPIALAEAVKK